MRFKKRSPNIGYAHKGKLYALKLRTPWIHHIVYLDSKLKDFRSCFNEFCT